jgi:hydrogenase expression/formation protein HypE
MRSLPTGKLPPDILRALLSRHTPSDPRVVLPPGIGLDCAVLDLGDRLLVAKSDPITFAEDDIGWYAVHVNANDVATSGAQPRWFLATLLLPQGQATAQLASAIFDQIGQACGQIGASLVGGHTEITAGIDRPIVAGTMLGEVGRERLVTPRGARPGDALLLTKGIPLEGASLLAREFAPRLAGVPPEIVDRARAYLRDPGISVVAEALAASRAGGVNAMHDPTEGGLAAALWELAEASQVALDVDVRAVPVLPEAARLCRHLGLDPMDTLASGALLICAQPGATERVIRSVSALGVAIRVIGTVHEGSGVTMFEGEERATLPRPERDALAILFDQSDNER